MYLDIYILNMYTKQYNNIRAKLRKKKIYIWMSIQLSVIPYKKKKTIKSIILNINKKYIYKYISVIIKQTTDTGMNAK